MYMSTTIKILLGVDPPNKGNIRNLSPMNQRMKEKRRKD